MVKQPLTGPRYRPPTPAIRVGAVEPLDAEMRYGAWLVGYMRVLAMLCLAQGVFLWSRILMAPPGSGDLFATISFVGGAAVIFFCVIDLIAAVGLWLAAAWGGVVWLVAVSAQWMAVLTLPGLFPYDRSLGLIDVALVVGYFYLTFCAARESEARDAAT